MNASFTAAITILAIMAALTMPTHVAAQQHHHYKLIDLGTFGGPNSGFNENFLDFAGGATVQVLSNEGTAIGVADTSTPDPLCFIDGCFYVNGLQWRDGNVTNLSPLPGGQWSSPYWMSGNGLIAGASETGQTDPFLGIPEFHGVIWQNGVTTDLGILEEGYFSWALSVNNQGHAVGFAFNTIPDPNSIACVPGFGCTQTRAFLWHDGVMHDLGTLGGSDAIASMVNNRGQVAGVSYTGTDPSTNCFVVFNSVLITHPFLWDKQKGMIDLGTLGGTCAQPNAINSRGQVVGVSNLAGDTSFHGFVWNRGVLSDIGTLGGSLSSAVWVNDAGDVIGGSLLPGDGVGHGFLLKHGRMIDLGTLNDGNQCSNVWSINASEQIVGGSLDCQNPQNGTGHASLWESGGPMVDLNTLVTSGSDLILTYAFFINDRGEIAAQGALPNNDSHAVVLVPCDENHPNIDGCD